MQAFSEVENTDPAQHQKWLDKHGFKPGEDGTFPVDSFEGKGPVTVEKLLENIRINVSSVDYTPLYAGSYDERTFVMICGGPSLENHLDEIRVKSLDPKYCVVCSNMTGKYLTEHGIVPYAHFVLDPQEKKKFDVDEAKPEIQYWINAACHPAVFAELKEQNIKPYMFLADFDADGRAIKAVADSLQPGQSGMMAIQGGTMAGLRAMNICDALGFRDMEYYGFDACVQVSEGRAKPYAYEKKRGEAIITVGCDRCDASFDTTLIFQKQVNEFTHWRFKMPWIDIKIIGGGLISHAFDHLKEIEAAEYHSTERFTPEYKELQLALHDKGSYGTTGRSFVPTIFHAISQLLKRHGSVSVLDYGSAGGNTMKTVKDMLYIPPGVEDTCYDPFVAEFASPPAPADLVLCTDVMEHVEPQCTKAVLDHIASLTKRLVFFSIALKPANKDLADGRNAHINLRSAEYWLREIKKRFITSEAKADGEVVLAVGQAIENVRQTMRNANVA